MLNRKVWMLLMLGLCINLVSNILTFGTITKIKCKVRLVLMIFGTSSFLNPIFISISSYLSEFTDNHKLKILKFIKKNNLLCYIILYLFDFISILYITLTSTYRIKVVTVKEGMDFKTCKLNMSNYIVIGILYIIKFIVFISIVVISYVKWGDEIITNDIKISMLLIYTNVLNLILLITLNIENIKNIYVDVLLKDWITTFFTLFNYIILIWIRVYYEHESIKEQTEKHKNNSINASSKNKNKIFYMNAVNYSENKNQTTLFPSSFTDEIEPDSSIYSKNDL